ncbi:MAG: hypothetical protein EOO15_23070 [Chitinophagaceae bacterium]|nr:MAG: hypothetical protein EOO15_23070 [Chitinophagaceae bacterium]
MLTRSTPLLNEVRNAIQSEEFKEDLRNFVHYGANIKLEKFVAYALAKSMTKQGAHCTLEKKKVDLTVNGKSMELKFHYDFDIHWKLPKELGQIGKADSAPDSLQDYYDQLNSTAKSKSWEVMFGVLKDVLEKKCDSFLWIISERDFPTYSQVFNTESVCFWDAMRVLADQAPDGTIEEKVRKYFTGPLYKERPYEMVYETVTIDEPMVTKMHFFFLDFAASPNR